MRFVCMYMDACVDECVRVYVCVRVRLLHALSPVLVLLTCLVSISRDVQRPSAQDALVWLRGALVHVLQVTRHAMLCVEGVTSVSAG